MNLWHTLFQKQTEDWTFGQLSANQVPDEPKVNTRIQPDTGYITIQIKSFRVVNVRTLTKKFYGMVHSSVKLLRTGSMDTTFQTVSTPSELKNIDPGHLDRVITNNVTLTKNVPYRGGEVYLEIGLFSVEEGDLAAPYLNLLTELAEKAGVGIINTALPFVEPIRNGVNAIIGSVDGSILEVGYAATLDPPETGWYTIIRAPKSQKLINNVKVTPDDYKLVYIDSDIPLKDYPYFVFTITLNRENPEWYKLPYISDSYARLQEAARIGNYTQVQELFTIFKRAALTSEDLLFEDAQRLSEKVKAKLDVVLGGSLVSKGTTASLQDLKSYNIFI